MVLEGKDNAEVSSAIISSSAGYTTWKECVMGADWLRNALVNTLHYTSPLPVQQAVVPRVMKAFLSGVPLDVSLTAPTGSGKTLCYLLPALRLIAEAKKGVDDVRLRCLVLVPTLILGQQVYREVQRLTQHTTILPMHWCQTDGSGGRRGGGVRDLLRRVRCPGGRQTIFSTKKIASEGASDNDNDKDDVDDEESEGDAGDPAKDEIESGAVLSGLGCDNLPLGSISPFGTREADASSVAFYVRADILIATPQRLLQELDRVDRRIHLLSSLQMLVIDEADQVLGGHFANAVTKVVERFEVEKHREFKQEEEAAMEALYTVNASQVGENADSLCFPRRRASSFGGAPDVSLHKILCSATLSSRVARISEVRLRNCVFFSLDTNGQSLQPESESSSMRHPVSTSTRAGKPLAGTLVRKKFSLPPTLQEHIVFVEDRYRHAVLLKLIREIVQKQKTLSARAQRALEKQRNRERQRHEGMDEEEEDDVGEEDKEEADKDVTANYPTVEPGTGGRILVFCSSGDEARVVAHFLHAGGVKGVLEFTTAATEEERRRVLLMQSSSCIVASDALMRGIDIPGVGHVVNYHPPESLPQLIHRAGRTARAMRRGHLHLLLTKGPNKSAEPQEESEGAAEDQMAQYYRLSASVARSMPLSFERRFFVFRTPPSQRPTTTPPHPIGTGTSKEGVLASSAGSEGEDAASAGREGVSSAEGFTQQDAEWWVEEANRCLAHSQHQLQRSWVSVMESATQKAANDHTQRKAVRSDDANRTSTSKGDAATTSNNRNNNSRLSSGAREPDRRYNNSNNNNNNRFPRGDGHRGNPQQRWNRKRDRA